MHLRNARKIVIKVETGLDEEFSFCSTCLSLEILTLDKSIPFFKAIPKATNSTQF